MIHHTIKKQFHQFRGRLRNAVRTRNGAWDDPERQHWSIGIYAGASPLLLRDNANTENPVLTHKDVSDVPAQFVADPFMLRADGKWSMFFEVWNRTVERGQIGLATSDDALRWRYCRIVLAEPFHLSYPYVFEWKNEHYMIPETHAAGSIRLYKAEKFPDQWSFLCTPIEGVFSDPSVVYYEGRWWMFAQTNFQQRFGTLHLFFAEELTGRWQEHPMSPIIKGNNRIARPAGRVQVIDGRLIRFAQDCYPVYGTRVRAFEISELSTTTYRESECPESPILGPGGVGWNKSGMHHVDLHKIHDAKWIACVDGCVIGR